MGRILWGGNRRLKAWLRSGQMCVECQSGSGIIESTADE